MGRPSASRRGQSGFESAPRPRATRSACSSRSTRAASAGSGGRRRRGASEIAGWPSTTSMLLRRLVRRPRLSAETCNPERRSRQGRTSVLPACRRSGSSARDRGARPGPGGRARARLPAGAHRHGVGTCASRLHADRARARSRTPDPPAQGLGGDEHERGAGLSSQVRHGCRRAEVRPRLIIEPPSVRPRHGAEPPRGMP